MPLHPLSTADSTLLHLLLSADSTILHLLSTVDSTILNLLSTADSKLCYLQSTAHTKCEPILQQRNACGDHVIYFSKYTKTQSVLCTPNKHADNTKLPIAEVLPLLYKS